MNAPSCIHRVNSSGDLPDVGGMKPPTSAPANANPDSPRFNSCGIEIRMWFHDCVLSPVHVAA